MTAPSPAATGDCLAGPHGAGAGVLPARALWQLLPLYLVIFIGFVGYSLMITVFTPAMLHNSAGLLPVASAPAERSVMLGVLLALYPLGQFLGSPVLGALSDRFGRRPVIVWSLVATSACYAVIVVALSIGSFPLLAAASLLAGLGEANIVSAQGAVADVTRPEQRGRYFGYIYLSVSLAYIVGPLVGGKLADPSLISWFDDATPFAAVLLLLLGSIALVAFRFRETRAPDRRGGPFAVGAAFGALTMVVSDRRLRRLFLANFLLYLAIFGFFRAYPMYLVGAFGLGVSTVSEFVAWVGLPIVLVNLGLTGFLSARSSDRTITIWSAALSGVFVAGVVLPATTIWLWPILFLAGGAVAICLPACATLLSRAAGDREQGRVMGCNQGLQVAAEALSGLTAGLLAALAVALPLLTLGAIALAAAGFVAAMIPRSPRNRS